MEWNLIHPKSFSVRANSDLCRLFRNLCTLHIFSNSLHRNLCKQKWFFLKKTFVGLKTFAKIQSYFKGAESEKFWFSSLFGVFKIYEISLHRKLCRLNSNIGSLHRKLCKLLLLVYTETCVGYLYYCLTYTCFCASLFDKF